MMRIRNERGDTAVSLTEIKRITEKCYEHLHVNNLDKLDKMNKGTRIGMNIRNKITAKPVL